MLSKIPLRRYGDPELDIGRAVAWACGPDARYLTGSTLMLDGGQMHLR
jgi:NAD(P)-dependent dehydrogenase (short-subunit alcohol dehydrogenase family)